MAAEPITEAGETTAAERRPLVIAHRGASGYLPEHTLAAYALAIDQGADFIEPDLVVTRDGILVARHENELSGSTDVAQHSEFRRRRTRKVIDGKSVEGWFSEDFALSELKTLRAREPRSGLRPRSAAFDGCFQIPTLQEIIDLLTSGDGQAALSPSQNHPAGRLRCGIYPELKHSAYYSAIGIDIGRLLLETLRSSGLPKQRAYVFIQSFEMSALKELRRLTDLPLVQLLDVEGRSYDIELAGDTRTYRDLITPQGLSEIGGYADAIGPAKDLVLPRSADGTCDRPSTLLDDAHRAGLLVHAWTFRIEDELYPAHLGNQSSQRNASANVLAGEIGRFLAAGLDGLFTDNPDVGVRMRDAVCDGRRRSSNRPRGPERMEKS